MTDGPTIPVHLVLGGLGSGKSTVILELLKTRPTKETWAVFVNEFGQVSIDPELIAEAANKSDGLIVHESSGGCICCSGALELETGIKEIVRDYKPDRILIEPTGLSDPRSLKNQVLQRGESWGVHLASTIGILDIRIVGHQRFKEMPFIRTLIASSDYIFGSKSDRVSLDVLQRFLQRVEKWNEHQGSLFTDRTELSRSSWKTTSLNSHFTFFHEESDDAGQSHFSEKTKFPELNAELYIDYSKEHTAVGWIIEQETLFDRTSVLSYTNHLLNTYPQIIRTKGFVNTTDGWIMIQSGKEDSVVLTESLPRKDSRILLIMESNPIDELRHPAFLAQLMAIPADQKQGTHPHPT